jgi:hypothetical protein
MRPHGRDQEEVMKTKILITIALGVIISCMMTAPARADEENQETRLTFDHAVQVPGKILPAGTYWFVLAENDADRNIVEIFNEDRTRLYATLFTVPSTLPNAADDTELTFARIESNETPALMNWAYPGELTGHEFVYSKSDEPKLLRAEQKTVTVTPAGTNVGF